MNTTVRITVRLTRSGWLQVVDALYSAVQYHDGPGWCFCPEAGDDDLCRACGASMALAEEYRELARDITFRLGDRRGRIALTFSADTLALMARGTAVGADHGEDSLGYECFRASRAGVRVQCPACAADRKSIDIQRALARRLRRASKRIPTIPGHRARAAHGTRAR